MELACRPHHTLQVGRCSVRLPHRQEPRRDRRFSIIGIHNFARALHTVVGVQQAFD